MEPACSNLSAPNREEWRPIGEVSESCRPCIGCHRSAGGCLPGLVLSLVVWQHSGDLPAVLANQAAVKLAPYVAQSTAFEHQVPKWGASASGLSLALRPQAGLCQAVKALAAPAHSCLPASTSNPAPWALICPGPMLLPSLVTPVFSSSAPAWTSAIHLPLLCRNGPQAAGRCAHRPCRAVRSIPITSVAPLLRLLGRVGKAACSACVPKPFDGR